MQPAKSSFVHKCLMSTIGLLVMVALPSVAQVDEDGFCSGLPFIVQSTVGQLRWPTGWSEAEGYEWSDFGSPAEKELNNMGFHKDSNLLYALELTPSGNNGVVTIDHTGTVMPVASSGITPDKRFDAGDLSPEGDKFYVNEAGRSPLYVVDVDSMTAGPPVTITGGIGNVHDWAAHPTNGLLYGGDSTHGQLAVLNPVTGVRTDHGFTVDFEHRPVLPKGVPFGAAWFDATGHLVLHANDGGTYTIDVGEILIVGWGKSPASSRNDAAACPVEVEVERLRCYYLGLFCRYLFEGESIDPDPDPFYDCTCRF